MKPKASACCIALVLVLCPIPVAANPPLITPGHVFHETFEDGFDHPGTATIADGLTLEPGVAILGSSGHLAYDFVYDPVWGFGELRDTDLGSFWVEFVDDLQFAGQFSITLTTDADGSYCDCEMVVQLSIQGSNYLVSLSYAPYGPTSALIPRANGTTRFGFPSDPLYPTLMIENQQGQHILATYGVVMSPLRPRDLSIEGSGLAIDSVALESYTVVGTEGTSWGELKAQQ